MRAWINPSELKEEEGEEEEDEEEEGETNSKEGQGVRIRGGMQANTARRVWRSNAPTKAETADLQQEEEEEEEGASDEPKIRGGMLAAAAATAMKRMEKLVLEKLARILEEAGGNEEEEEEEEEDSENILNELEGIVKQAGGKSQLDLMDELKRVLGKYEERENNTKEGVDPWTKFDPWQKKDNKDTIKSKQSENEKPAKRNWLRTESLNLKLGELMSSVRMMELILDVEPLPTTTKATVANWEDAAKLRKAAAVMDVQAKIAIYILTTKGRSQNGPRR